jgi:maltose alpha-D-glucosyltransferase / alpha-amylase
MQVMCLLKCSGATGSPVIDEDPYVFPLQFKNYFWFELKEQVEEERPDYLSPDSRLELTSKEWNQMNVSTQNALKISCLVMFKKAGGSGESQKD